ncbi:MAG: hypothetical protein NTY07_08505 [Bacteroidia bacterium]|nr:hypothetical protein [Bacteroidia bacterium]
MFKTTVFTIWPDNLDFFEKIKRLSESIKSEFKLKTATYGDREWDNKFSLWIDQNEHYVCDSENEFLEILNKRKKFQSFRWHLCLKPRGLFKSDFICGIGIDFDNRKFEVSSHSDNLSFVDRAIQIVKEEFVLSKPEFIDNDGYRRKMLSPKIFISRHFDEYTYRLYYRFESFLQLLGFDVKQGEEYTSSSIPDKVKHRIDEQEILMVLVTGQRNHEWLTAEIGYAMGKDKHILLLIEENTDFNKTILGKDLEYILMDRNNIDNAFCSILREFKSIGIKGLYN